jgi:hypothetical protein
MKVTVVKFPSIGACGIPVSNDQLVVSVSKEFFDSYP